MDLGCSELTVLQAAKSAHVSNQIPLFPPVINTVVVLVAIFEPILLADVYEIRQRVAWGIPDDAAREV